jgi:tripartite-type tricarboxylate transporter receptor subunit TctC
VVRTAKRAQRRTGALLRGCIVAGMALLSPCAAIAQDAAPFEWKRLTVFIGTTTGGGYDAYARLLARHMGKYLPGQPVATPSNRPGAGGLAMMNQLYTSGAKDGTELGVAAPGFSIDRVFYGDQSHAVFDSSKFNWIGSMAQDPSVFVAWRSKGFTLKDLLAGKPMTVGMPGPGGGPWFYSRGLNALFGTKMNIVTGYPGVAEVLLAIENGEVDGVAGTTWSGLKATRGRWFESGAAEVLLQYSKERMPDLPNVPTLSELMTNQDQRDIMGVIASLEVITRPVFAPPDIPAARVAVLREAFDKTMRDPELLAEAERMKLPIQPVTGTEAQAIVAKISAPPQTVVDKLRVIYRE